MKLLLRKILNFGSDLIMSYLTIMTADLSNLSMILAQLVIWKKNLAKSLSRIFINKYLDLIGKLLSQTSYKVLLDTALYSIFFPSKTDIIIIFLLTLMGILSTLITLSSYHHPLVTWVFKRHLLSSLQIIWNLCKGLIQIFLNISNFFSFLDLNSFVNTKSK